MCERHLRIDLKWAAAFTGAMRILLVMALLVAVSGGGCASRKHASASSPQQPASGPAYSKAIITPDTRLIGKVVSFDPEGRFAVLNFPIGHLPAFGQRLSVYRSGLKVGEINVTGPQRDDNIVGDVMAGEARTGDEVREQ